MFSESRFLEQMRFDLDQAKSVPELNIVVQRIAKHSSLKHVLYHLPRPPDGRCEPITLQTCATEWVKHYYESREERLDPGMVIPSSAVVAVDWSEAPPSSRSLRLLFGATRDDAVGRFGMTIPLRGRLGESALFSFTSDGDAHAWRELKCRRLATLRRAAFLLHDRVLAVAGGRDEPPLLSSSELHCLECLARGLALVAVAQRLGISQVVVEAYLESARHKLGASSVKSSIQRARASGIMTQENRQI
jgi:DNA-binding CsgD family transcriptional regulator